MPEKFCNCPCGKRPTIESDGMTGMVAIECGNCARIVGAVGRAECIRMWNAACCNMVDPVPAKARY